MYLRTTNMAKKNSIHLGQLDLEETGRDHMGLIIYWASDEFYQPGPGQFDPKASFGPRNHEGRRDARGNCFSSAVTGTGGGENMFPFCE